MLERAPEVLDRPRPTASQIHTFKSVFGLASGTALIVLGLAFAAVGQLVASGQIIIMALGFILFGFPLALWGASTAQPPGSTAAESQRPRR